jgi:hypothetical protein
MSEEKRELIRAISVPIVVRVSVYLGDRLGLDVKPTMYLMIGLATALYAVVAVAHVRGSMPDDPLRPFMMRVTVVACAAVFVAFVTVIEATEWAEHRGLVLTETWKSMIFIVIVLVPVSWMLARFKSPTGHGY